VDGGHRGRAGAAAAHQLGPDLAGTPSRPLRPDRHDQVLHLSRGLPRRRTRPPRPRRQPIEALVPVAAPVLIKRLP
jgi:hypothetical protein